MTTRFLLVFFFSTINFTIINAQDNTVKKTTLTGIVTDYDGKPIKGVRIFIDSLKTKVKTDKKGFYNAMISPKSKIVTVFSANHGVIDIDYTGQNKINFIFPKEATIISKREFSNLGYGASNYGNNDPDYSSYTDIFQLLKAKFQNVQVIGESISIRGTGRNLSGNSFTPIFIVNGSQVSNIASISPSDIKSISVERGNTSLYGSRGAGGVIKIKLK